MSFDLPTLLVTVMLASLICTGARLLLWRLHPSLPGLGQWALACFLGSLTLGLTATVERLPELVSMTLGQVLAILGYVSLWIGFRRFTGSPALGRLRLAAILGGLLFATGLVHMTHSVPLRLSFNCALMAAFSLLTARELLRAASDRLAMRLTGWLYLLNAAFFLGGIVAVQDMGATVQMRSDRFDSISLLWWLGVTIAATLGMALMTGERLRDVLAQQASLDPLTGALNRRAFEPLFVREQARARRSAQPMSLLMADLDHFKRINDRLGHAGGDAVLKAFSGMAREILRGNDVFCRWGGEEFVVLLPGTAQTQALQVGERLRRTFAAGTVRLAAPGQEAGFTVSLGVAQWQVDESLESLMRRADEALYRAKSEGRDRCVPALVLQPG